MMASLLGTMASGTHRPCPLQALRPQKAMDIEAYRKRIMGFPIERLSALIEEDPDAAEEWSAEEGKLAEEYAAANGIELDETTKELIFEQIFTAIKDDPSPQRAGMTKDDR